jgi:NAD(P)-dependent dehydrogenase (short-subunit alcohol dehydrogenase family)
VTASGLFDLSGRVALVTGGGRGLGRSIAVGFADAGADVILASRNEAVCTDVAREIEARTGRRALGCRCHLAHWSEIDALVDRTYAEFDHVDILVNNAGSAPRYDAPALISEELYDKTLAVNLKGHFRLTALVGTRMAAGHGGSIINMSSWSALRPDGTVIPYAAAKAGLNAMTVAFAHAFGPSVRVNAIIPGAFLTDISKAWNMEQVERSFREDYALGRGGLPDEIVGTAIYLASNASTFTSGAMIRVDGGAP